MVVFNSKLKSTIFVLGLFAFLLTSSSCLSDQKDSISKVCFDDVCFDVEVAQTDEEVKKGLMYRESMPEKSGMLFVFESQEHRVFWMKNTLIPLDMIWIDANEQVVGVLRSALPCVQDPCPHYPSMRPAKYVLEINGGLVKKYAIERGQNVIFQ